MGVGLFNKKGEDFYANWSGWYYLLRTAYDHGWVPKGTVKDTRNPTERSMDYFHNDFQGVTADDSAAIADALETAVIEIDRGNPELAAFIRKFIKFCRGGTFAIS